MAVMLDDQTYKVILKQTIRKLRTLTQVIIDASKKSTSTKKEKLQIKEILKKGGY